MMRTLLLAAILFAAGASGEIVVKQRSSVVTVEDCETGDPIAEIPPLSSPEGMEVALEGRLPLPLPGVIEVFCGSGVFEWVRANTELPPDPNGPIATPSAGIVYTRVPLTTSQDFIKAGETLSIDHLSVHDRLPEVANPYYAFNGPGQLVWLKPDGSERVIYDCFTTEKPCVPFDASVSLDGTQLAFTVYSADSLVNGKIKANETLPNLRLSSSGAESSIHIYTFATGELFDWPHEEAAQELSPIWLPDGRMMFASDRHGEYSAYIPRSTPSNKIPPRLYTANVDGSDVRDVTPHNVSGSIHPWLLNDGRVAFSERWFSHNQPFVGTNGSTQFFTTLENMWILAAMNHVGGDANALLGAHRNSITADGGGRKTMKALHFIDQLPNGDICVANYYRRNNMGLGDVWCFPPQPKGIEGPTPDFMPEGIYNVADWSKSNDEPSRDTEEAKIGFPGSTLDNQLLLSVGQGWCTTVAYGYISTPQKITNAGHVEGCDVGIYKTTQLPSKSLDDLEPIVDSPDWHEFGAKEIHARNVQLPELSTTGDESCVLTSSDAGTTDAHHYGEYVFNKMYRAMANNGAEIHGLDHSELAAIRLYEVLPNTTKAVNNIAGNNLQHLGDIPLLADNSFAAEVPCDTPFVMAGLDSSGRIIKRDQNPMSLRPGEKRVCTGCHLHSEEGRPYEDSLAFTAEPVEVSGSLPVPTWTQDIAPIVANRCAGCHTDGPFEDYDQLTRDWRQDHALSKVQMSTSSRSSKRWGLQRPATSQYVNSMFARESSLYWYFMESRQDGRTNEQYSDDIDYLLTHPAVGATEAEQRLLAFWLDSGYPE